MGKLGFRSHMCILFPINIHQVSGVYDETCIVVTKVQLKRLRQLNSFFIRCTFVVLNLTVLHVSSTLAASSVRDLDYNWFKRRTIPARNSIVIHFNFVWHWHVAVVSNSVELVSKLSSLPEGRYIVISEKQNKKVNIGRWVRRLNFWTVWNQMSHQSQYPGHSGIYWKLTWLYYTISNSVSYRHIAKLNVHLNVALLCYLKSLIGELKVRIVK